MKTKLGVWTLLCIPPIIFAIILFCFLVYHGAHQLTEEQVSLKITEAIPIILFLSQLGMLITLLVYAKKSNHNIFHQTFKSPYLLKDIVIGILLGIGVAISYFQFGILELVTFLQTRLGDYVPAGDTSNSVSEISLLFFVFNVILAPFVEENIYRNIAFKELRNRYSPIVSVIVTSVFFGLLHWLGGFWYIVVTGIFIGIPFGILQLKRESILLVFTAHLALNLYEFINSMYF